MTQASPSLIAIFGRFLRFGCLAWGGPVAQIAMIKRELVDEQQWLSPTRFNRLLAVFQILPGPEAHELCVHLGMMKRGRLGGLLAGLGFMLPGLILMLGLAWAYQRLDLSQPPWQALLLGVQLAVIALILRAAHRIAQHALGDRWLRGIAIGSIVAAIAGISFWIALPVAGALYAIRARRGLCIALCVLGGAALVTWLAMAEPAAAAAATELRPLDGNAAGSMTLFLSGLKAGLLTFGGAYTAIPFIRDDVVGRGWISDAQFLDGLALSSIIPAPLIIFATFVGYQAGGLTGALAMTAGVFLPAFAFSLLLFDRLEKVVADRRLHNFLAGVAAAVVGLIVATLIELASNVVGRVPSLPVAALIFVAALGLLYIWRSKVNVLAVLPMAAMAGWLAFE